MFHFKKPQIATPLAISLASAALILTPLASAHAHAKTPPVGEFPVAARGKAENFALNLAPTTSTAEYERALNTIPGGPQTKILWGSPEIKSIFVQTSDPDFPQAAERALAAAGIPLDSLGPTRQAPVSPAETVVELPSSPPGAETDAPAAAPAPQPDKDAAPAPDEPAQTRSVPRTRKNDPKRHLNPAPSPTLPVGPPTYPPHMDPTSAAFGWGNYATRAYEAADVPVKREDVIVGVLDDGIGLHPDLAPVLDTGKSVDCSLNGQARTGKDERGHYYWEAHAENGSSDHGLHVAGTIAAARDGKLLEGIATNAGPHKYVKVASVKVERAGSFYPEYVTCGFLWSGREKFAVTNNSYYVDPWLYWLDSDPAQAAGLEVVRRAVKWSQEQGVLHVAAAGNDSQNLDHIRYDSKSPNDSAAQKREFTPKDHPLTVPAMLPGVVSVSAINLPFKAWESDFYTDTDPGLGDLEIAKNGPFSRAWFSNYGEQITVTAPGEDIISASFNGETELKSGTSMAAPHASAVAALLKSIDPRRTPEQLENLLKKHAARLYNKLTPPRPGQEYRGAGLVNALAAVLLDQPRPQIGDLEYSLDAKTWRPLPRTLTLPAGSKVTVRSKLTGPVTRAELGVDVQPVHPLDPEDSLPSALAPTPSDREIVPAIPFPTAHDKVTIQSDGAFDGQTVLENTYRVALPHLELPLTVNAYGRNDDARADDDATRSFHLTLKAAPPTLTVPTETREGQTVQLAADGFFPGQNVSFTLAGKPAGNALADAMGHAQVAPNLDRLELPAGVYEAVARQNLAGLDEDFSASARITVKPHAVPALEESSAPRESSLGPTSKREPIAENLAAVSEDSSSPEQPEVTSGQAPSPRATRLAFSGARGTFALAMALLIGSGGTLLACRARRRSSRARS